MRPTVVDRRLGMDRRDALPDTNLERRGPGRRRSDFRRMLMSARHRADVLLESH